MNAFFLSVIAVVLLSLHDYGRAVDASVPISPPGLPHGYVVPQETLSPNGGYGITAFDSWTNQIPDKIDKNKLIFIAI
jgi:hypothetical protein